MDPAEHAEGKIRETLHTLDWKLDPIREGPRLGQPKSLGSSSKAQTWRTKARGIKNHPCFRKRQIITIIPHDIIISQMLVIILEKNL
jgi:hypothetical protein